MVKKISEPTKGGRDEAVSKNKAINKTASLSRLGSRISGTNTTPKNTRAKPTVLVAMSGGVDSSVAALLMKQKGYNVIGAFMKNWSNTKNPLSGECDWKAERREASKIASLLGIKLITLDFEKKYNSLVVNEMFKLYKKGITPNPDVDCNNKIKFPLLWKAAKKLNADKIVTGHYAQVRGGGRGRGGKAKPFELHRAKDESKDQSYFLYRLTEKDLEHTLFPVGTYSKKQVREIAKKNKFPNYDKKSTTGICFIGKINLKEFLKQKIKPKKGKIISPEGIQIGEHDGIYYYTIGERLGDKFGIKLSKSTDNPQEMQKWYVAKKSLKNNTLTAAPEGHKILLRKNIIMKDVHVIDNKLGNKRTEQLSLQKLKGYSGENSDKMGGALKQGVEQNQTFPKQVNVRIRHVGELLPATIKQTVGTYKVTLKKPITGISEGQAIVLYKKNSKKVLGGGVISF